MYNSHENGMPLEHMGAVEEVLTEALRAHQLSAKVSKCEFKLKPAQW